MVASQARLNDAAGFLKTAREPSPYPMVSRAVVPWAEENYDRSQGVKNTLSWPDRLPIRACGSSADRFLVAA